MRLIAMGGEALAEGFALLGFETWANATPEDVEQVITDLLRSQERALVFLEHGLSRCKLQCVDRIRREGGHVVITEVPPIRTPEDYHPPVEDLVLRILGPSALEERK